MVGPLCFAVVCTEASQGAKQSAETLVEDGASAFLLSLPAELDATGGVMNKPGDSAGSTELDVLVSSLPATTAVAEPCWSGRPHAVSSFIGDTPGAANSILRKYLRRRRK
jgi:hypothetical protein